MNKYSLSTIFAGILWGIISLFLKNLSAIGFSSMQVLMFRGIISSVILFVFIFIKDKNLLKIKFADIWMFVGTGVISLTFFSICYFRTILEIGSSVAVILLYTSPIFVLIFSCILFKERINLSKIVALVLTFAGCIFVTGLPGSGSYISAKGIFIGICAGFGYALYSIFSRYALAKYDSLTVTFYTFVFSGLSIIPFCGMNHAAELISVKSVLLICGIALFCTVLPYIFYTFGLSGLETGKAAILVTVEPLVGTLIGIFVWNEDVSVLKVCGILMIFSAVILLGRKSEQN